MRQKPPQRITVGPAGVWYPMGVISQYYLPPQPGFSFEANTERISFFTRTGDERMVTSFADLRKKLWELGDCPQLVWGKTQSNEEENDNILLFMGMSPFFPWNGRIVTTLISSTSKIFGSLSTLKKKSRRRLEDLFKISRCQRRHGTQLVP